MMKSLFLWLGVFGLALMAPVFVPPVFTSQAGAQTAEAGVEFVRNAADAVIDILLTAHTQDEREARFAALLSERADLRLVGRFALGAHGRRIAKADYETYQNLLETMIVKIYASRLRNYKNERIVILNSRQKGRNVIVESEIQFADGRDPIPLHWWLVAQKQGGYKLFDIRVLGVWLAQEQRDTFSSVLKNNRGDVQALLAHLRTQINHAGEEVAAE